MLQDIRSFTHGTLFCNKTIISVKRGRVSMGCESIFQYCSGCFPAVMALIGSFKFSPALWAYPHIRFLRKSRFSSLSVPAVFLLQLPVYQRNIYSPENRISPTPPAFPKFPSAAKTLTLSVSLLLSLNAGNRNPHSGSPGS